MVNSLAEEVEEFSHHVRLRTEDFYDEMCDTFVLAIQVVSSAVGFTMLVKFYTWSFKPRAWTQEELKRMVRASNVRDKMNRTRSTMRILELSPRL